MKNNHSMALATTEYQRAVAFSIRTTDDDGSARLGNTTDHDNGDNNKNKNDHSNGAKIGLPLSGTKLLKCSSSRDTWVMIEDASI